MTVQLRSTSATLEGQMISDLEEATAVADSDQIELNQAGTSRSATRAQIVQSAKDYTDSEIATIELLPGPQGPPGAAGVPGATGPAGPGVPTGGTANQVLAKIDATNFNTQWVNQTGGGGGIPEAPNDGQQYARQSLGWSVVVGGGGGGAPSGPAGGDLAGTYPNPTLAAVGSAGTVGTGADTTISVTTDAKGRVTSKVAYMITPAAIGAAPIASPTFTGDPKAPTPATADNDTSVATTAYVKAQGYLGDAASDGNIYGRKDAAWVEVLNAGSPLGEFVFVSTTTSPPGGGQIRLNNATQTSATHVFIHGTSAPGVDAYNLLSTFLSIGGRLYLQNKSDATKWITLTITAIAYNTTWIDCTVTYFSGPGTLPSGQRTVLYVASQAPDLSGYAPLASPLFTGDPRAPTPATADNDTSIATTAFVKAQGYVTAAVTSVTGTAPVVSSGGNTPAISMAAATTSVPGYLTAADWTTFNGKAPLASPTFTGDPKAPTPAAGDNDTSIPTTAWVLGNACYVGTTAPTSVDNRLWWHAELATLFIRYNDGAGTAQWVPAAPSTTPGGLLQTVSTQTGAVATGTGVIPYDDTIPQITEGNEYMQLTITPKSATSKLVIDVTGVFAASVVGDLQVALFQDSTANALAVATDTFLAGNSPGTTRFTYVMTSGTTSSTTFRVRAGMGSAATTTFNGAGGVRAFGGAMASGIVIKEVL